GAYAKVQGVIGEETGAAEGLTLLLAGGAVLFLAGVFGVKARNWWRVFAGAIIVGSIVAWGLLSYVLGPAAP
ncbi:MAG: hypothetical protein ACC662_11700, partial [Planctomycetota bacterium]